jgi:hypothetical protein
MIERVEFDHDQRQLWITFRGSARYVYYDVPAAVFDALCNAHSTGVAFNELVKERFRWVRDPERRRFGPNR